MKKRPPNKKKIGNQKTAAKGTSRAKRKTATKEEPEKDFVADWLLLQRRMIGRSTQFFERLANLASQGSVEPREYIEESFKLWSGALEEWAEWLDPEAPVTNPIYPIIARVNYDMRSERGDIVFRVPTALFESCGEDATIELSTDGFLSIPDPANKLRPTATFAPEQNVRLQPETVTRLNRETALKVYGVASGVVPRDRYRGMIWGRASTMPDVTFPVAVVIVTIV